MLQTVNNYDKDVFNGDRGWVTGVDHAAGRVAVSFDDVGVDYDFSELDELQLSYAMTVHRAQGSEFPAVVVPVLTQHYPMLQRNLLYTAITRGRRLVVVVRSRRAMAMAVRNDRPGERNSMLGVRLLRTETGGGTVMPAWTFPFAILDTFHDSLLVVPSAKRGMVLDMPCGFSRYTPPRRG